MLRIVILSQGLNGWVVDVHGRIAGEDVDVLAQELGVVRMEQLILGLSGVPFVDDAGARLLQRWVDEGARLRGATPFLQALLGEYGLESR